LLAGVGVSGQPCAAEEVADHNKGTIHSLPCRDAELPDEVPLLRAARNWVEAELDETREVIERRSDIKKMTKNFAALLTCKRQIAARTSSVTSFAAASRDSTSPIG
jgi:hypothetical protein